MEIEKRYIKNSRMDDIEGVEAKRHNAVQIRDKYYKMHYKPFNVSTKKVGNFWGYRKTKGGKSLAMYYCDKLGLSWSWVLNGNKKNYQFDIFIAPDKELPLFMPDNLDNKAKEALEQRLKGTTKQCKHRQDLIDLHVKLEKRYDHICDFIRLCDIIMNRIIKLKYQHLADTRSKVLLKLKMNGREHYYSQAPYGNFHPLSLDGDSRIYVEL